MRVEFIIKPFNPDYCVFLPAWITAAKFIVKPAKLT